MRLSLLPGACRCASSWRTMSAARSGVNLNSSNSRSPGAEAPKPVHREHRAVVGGPALPAERRRRLDRRAARARPAAAPRPGSLGCAANSSHDGIETTRTRTRSAWSSRAAARPRAPRSRWRSGSPAARRPADRAATYAPRRTPSAGPERRRGRAPGASGGRAPARSARRVRVIATRHASTVSVASAGPEHDEVGDGAEHREVLDRLVGRAVLADADRIVGADVDHRQPHDGRQPDRRLHVVGEDQEGAAERRGARRARRCR